MLTKFRKLLVCPVEPRESKDRGRFGILGTGVSPEVSLFRDSTVALAELSLALLFVERRRGLVRMTSRFG